MNPEDIELGPGALEFDAATAGIPETLGEDPLNAQPGQAGSVDGQPQPGGLTVDSIAATVQMACWAMAQGKGREFWQLPNDQAKAWAEAAHPVLAPMWAQYFGNVNSAWFPLAMVTIATFGPRVMQEISLRESMTANMVTAKSGDSSTSQAQPGAANPSSPIDWSHIRGVA